MEKKQDRRVVRTRKAIRNSFIKLLSEKEIDKITIKEIADGADVDRKTVYNYYNGIYEILDEIENELVFRLHKAAETFVYGSTETKEVFTGIRLLIEENFELAALLMKINGNSRLTAKIVVELQSCIRQVLGKNSFVSLEKIDLATEYIAAGMFAAYRYWFNSDRKQSLADFTDDLSRLVTGGLPRYFFNL